MKFILKGSFSDEVFSRVLSAGYVWHCIQNDKLCFHKRIDENRFPRFHLLVSLFQKTIEFQFHIDQRSLAHKGNHDQPWAYEGTRVQQEMHRVVMFLTEEHPLGQVAQPNLETSTISPHLYPTNRKEQTNNPLLWKAIIKK